MSNIPQEFQDKFIREITGKQPHEILQILNKYSAIDFNGMTRFVIKKEFEKLVEKKGGLCVPCQHQKIPRGVIDELSNQYAKERRQIYNIVKLS